MVYRNDIDGLRALAVISVILFHLGFLTSGYLGVDIFFVISGFLITKIIYQETLKNNFSILRFYQRRIRRILPLLFTVTLVCLLLGIFVLLPTDLVELSKAVIASDFSFNNILMYITTGGYWETTNDFKPLMHTWSLGVEEQFYVIYPLVFLAFSKAKIKYIVFIIISITVISIFLFLIQKNLSIKFFLLQCRFYELSFGGLAAIFISGKIKKTIFSNLLQITFVILLFLILSNFFNFNNELSIFLTVILTSVILLFGEVLNTSQSWYYKIFTNHFVTFIGKISFSLYMWHQVIFSFARMTILREISVVWAIILTLITFVLATLSYFFIENFFRRKNNIGFKSLLKFLAALLILSCAIAIFLISRAGIVKDIPSLDIYTKNVVYKNILSIGQSNVLLTYNNRINKLHENFDNTSKKKVLVIGDSYARDAANILLESKAKNKIELRFIHIDDLYTDKVNKKMLLDAEFLLFSFDNFESKSILKKIETKLNIKLNTKKVIFFGTKNFGSNFHSGYDFFQSSYFPNNSSIYYSTINNGTLLTNVCLQKEWKDQYVDLITPMQKKGTNQVKLFTPEHKMISFDTAHLTEAGAKFYAKILDKNIENFLEK